MAEVDLSTAESRGGIARHQEAWQEIGTIGAARVELGFTKQDDFGSGSWHAKWIANGRSNSCVLGSVARQQSPSEVASAFARLREARSMDYLGARAAALDWAAAQLARSGR